MASVNVNKLALARTVLQVYGPQDRKRMNCGEKAILDAAIILTIKTLLPRGKKAAALQQFGEELAEQRSRAEDARIKREQKQKKEGNVIAPDLRTYADTPTLKIIEQPLVDGPLPPPVKF